jgi:hypothetical protein
MDLGATADANDEPDDDNGGDGGGVPGFGVRAVERGSRVGFYFIFSTVAFHASRSSHSIRPTKFDRSGRWA